MQINLIDILLILIFCVAIWTGWKRGFIVGSLGLLTWIGSVVAGLLFYPTAAKILDQFFPVLGVWLLPVAFILIVVITGILLSFLARKILLTTPVAAHYNGTNKILGIIPGIVNGMIWGIILSAILLTLPLANGITATSRESKIAERLANKATWIESKMAPVFDDALNQTIAKL